MKKLIFILLTALLFTSCTNSEGSYWFIFYPRTVNHMFLYSASKNPIIWDNTIQGYEYHLYSIYEAKISIDSFALEIWTHNLNIDSIAKTDYSNLGELLRDSLSPSISNLEEQLRSSYIKHSKSSSSSSSTGEATNPIEIEYRTNGVSKLDIYALDATLFTKAPGTSLNNYFEIGRYQPWFLASYESQSLLYGFYDKSIPSSIEEWLYDKPYAQAEMYLEFNQEPSNLPVTTRFVVEMTLDNGKQLCDTSAYITIYK